MALLTSANATALPWNDVQKTPYGDSYQPVMALAQNHIHFIDVPGTPAGDANIFVIHCAYNANFEIDCIIIAQLPFCSLVFPAGGPVLPHRGW